MLTTTKCSHSLIPQSMWILITVILIVLLIVCFFLMVLLCKLTIYYKRTLLTLIADKKTIHCEDVLVKDFHSKKINCPSKHLSPHDQLVMAVNVYETMASTNQSFYDKSVYLVNQTVSEVGSLEESLHSADMLPMKVIEEQKIINANFSLHAEATNCCVEQAAILKCDNVECTMDDMSYQVATMDFCDESGIANDEI